MEETFTALRDKPCNETVKASAEKTVQTVKALNCQVCSTKIAEGMRDYLDLFTGKIEEAISQVSCVVTEIHSQSDGFRDRLSSN